MSGGSGFIGPFDNTGDWEITLQAKFSNTNCGIGLYAPTDTTRDNNCVKVIGGSDRKIYAYVNGTEVTQNVKLYLTSYNTYEDYTIKKSNDVLTFQKGTDTAKTVSWSLINTLSTLAIGVDSWGHTATIKNIVVKPL